MIVALAGPELMQIAFWDRFDYDRAGLLIVTVGMGLYLAATTLNQAALAQGRARAAAPLLGALRGRVPDLGCCSASLESRARVEVGFLAAAVALAVVARPCVYRARTRPSGVRPGSVEEIEVRLATADEALLSAPT